MLEFKSMENTTKDIANMPEKTYTDAELEAGYAELAADMRRESEERQAIDTALRKSSRRVRPRNAGIDESGNPIQGMWSVVLSTGEPYEQSYDRGVGLFNHLATAEAYCDAYDEASSVASGKTVNQYESTFCRIEFIPFGEFNPVFHTLYTVETDREDKGSEDRTISSATANIISEKNLLKMISTGSNPYLAAIWADKSLAVAVNNDRESSSQEIISSEIFSPVKTISWITDDGKDSSYIDGAETFLTFDPANVVLKKR